MKAETFIRAWAQRIQRSATRNEQTSASSTEDSFLCWKYISNMNCQPASIDIASAIRQMAALLVICFAVVILCSPAGIPDGFDGVDVLWKVRNEGI